MNTNDPEIITRTIDDFVWPDAQVRTPLPINVTGAAALKQVFLRLHQAYPDLHVAIEDMIAEGDKVVLRNVVTGTHGASTWASREPVSPSHTTRSLYFASAMAESLKPGVTVDYRPVAYLHKQQQCVFAPLLP
jgi:SnoaL-like polyketide cyclase